MLGAEPTSVTFFAWVERVSNCLDSRGHPPKLYICSSETCGNLVTQKCSCIHLQILSCSDVMLIITHLDPTGENTALPPPSHWFHASHLNTHALWSLLKSATMYACIFSLTVGFRKTLNMYSIYICVRIPVSLSWSSWLWRAMSLFNNFCSCDHYQHSPLQPAKCFLNCLIWHWLHWVSCSYAEN